MLEMASHRSNQERGSNHGSNSCDVESVEFAPLLLHEFKVFLGDVFEASSVKVDFEVRGTSSEALVAGSPHGYR